MVQLRHLEKALDAIILEGKIDSHERIIDEFLNENECISSSTSSKLHDILYKLWTSEEVQKQVLTKEAETEIIGITPISTNSSSTENKARHEELLRSKDVRVVFLEVLIRLAPCIINKEQLSMWWKDLRYYAIESTGHRLDLVNQSKRFISGVLTGSFYEYGDASNTELYTVLSCSFGKPILELYLSNNLPDITREEATDERVRFARQNCRVFFGQFARKETAAAFTMLNEYFVKPSYRIDVLDLVVEYISESQNSKLFRIYETPFFESLLNCLEKDRSRPALQLAITALSMFLVHICDKLVTQNLLNRIYACFGRACSWQPTKTVNDSDEDTSKPLESSDWKILEDEKLDEAEEATGNYDPETIDVIPLFTFLYGLFPINTLMFCRHCDDYFAKKQYKKRITDFWSRFMVTRKAESLVRQFRVDPMLVKTTEDAELLNALAHFQDVGSALGLTSICTSRRIVDTCHHHNHNGDEINLESIYRAGIISDQENENESPISNASGNRILSANEKGDEIGKKTEITNKNANRATNDNGNDNNNNKNKDKDKDNDNDGKGNDNDNDNEVTKCETENDFEFDETEKSNAVTPNDSINMGNDTDDSANIVRLLHDHKKAFQMHPEGSAGYWHRELLLIRNELAFANFSRDMSEQRALRWQKRASQRLIYEIRNEELHKINQLLSNKVNALESETQRALRSARTIMRERSAYESKILDKNREFRYKIRDLETQLLEMQKKLEFAQKEVRETGRLAVENQNSVAHADEELKSARNDIESAHREIAIAKGLGERDSSLVGSGEAIHEHSQIAKLQYEVKTLQYKIEQMIEENANVTKALQSEVLKAQSEVAAVKQDASQHKAPERQLTVTTANIIQEKNATINSLKGHNDDLSRRCAMLEHELRARKVHEEERMNELQAALMSSRPYLSNDVHSDQRFRGRGGAQGIPRRT